MCVIAVLSAVLSRLIAGPGPQSLPVLRRSFISSFRPFGRLRRLKGELVVPGLGDNTVLLPLSGLLYEFGLSSVLSEW